VRSAFLNRTVWVGGEVMSCRSENRLHLVRLLTGKLQCFLGHHNPAVSSKHRSQGLGSWMREQKSGAADFGFRGEWSPWGKLEFKKKISINELISCCLSHYVKKGLQQKIKPFHLNNKFVYAICCPVLPHHSVLPRYVTTYVYTAKFMRELHC